MGGSMKLYRTWEMMKLLDEDPSLWFHHSNDDLITVNVNDNTNAIECMNVRTSEQCPFESDDHWIMIERCELCEIREKGKTMNNVLKSYSRFRLGLREDVIYIQDICGHEDTLKINYCPLCGKDLK